jgi:hypothetical protein
VSSSPAVSGVKEKIIRERNVPVEELAAEQSRLVRPGFVELIETLTPERWANEDWRLAIVREDPKPSNYGGQNTLEQCQGVIEVAPGVGVPLDDWEQIQLAIKRKYGGKVYRLILKKGRERITEGKCINEAPPKFPEMNAANYYPGTMPTMNSASSSDANAIASKAIDTVANQPQEVMNIAINALRASAEMISRSASAPPAPPPAAANADSELDRAFKQAMIAKLLAEPPDPIKNFLAIKQALGDGNGNNPAGSGTINALLEPLLKAAVEKIINPVAPVVGRTTLLDLGREFIPVLGTTVRETMHEYRLSVEAQARIAELQRGMPPAAPQAAAAPSAQLPATVPAAAPNPPLQAAPPLTFPQIEEHIAKIVKNVEYPVEEAVDRVLSFLYDTDARLVGALLNPPTIDKRLKPGKEGLLMLFQYEPPLMPCMVNIPRVSEFIDKFIVAATEAEAAEARLRAAAPGAAAPAQAPV